MHFLTSTRIVIALALFSLLGQGIWLGTRLHADWRYGGHLTLERCKNVSFAASWIRASGDMDDVTPRPADMALWKAYKARGADPSRSRYDAATEALTTAFETREAIQFKRAIEGDVEAAKPFFDTLRKCEDRYLS